MKTHTVHYHINSNSTFYGRILLMVRLFLRCEAARARQHEAARGGVCCLYRRHVDLCFHDALPPFPLPPSPAALPPSPAFLGQALSESGEDLLEPRERTLFNATVLDGSFKAAAVAAAAVAAAAAAAAARRENVREDAALRSGVAGGGDRLGGDEGGGSGGGGILSWMLGRPAADVRGQVCTTVVLCCCIAVATIMCMGGGILSG